MAAQGGARPDPIEVAGLSAPATGQVGSTAAPLLFARTTTFQGSPGPMTPEARVYIRERVLPAVRRQRGFVRGTWLYDQETGKAAAIVVYDSEVAMREGEAADTPLVAQIQRDFGVPAPTLERFEVVAQAE